jgi:hypothetical protein
LRWTGVSPSPITTQKTLTARFVVREASGAVATQVRFYDQYGALVARRAGPRRASGAGSLPVLLRVAGRPLAPGLYRLQLTLTDQAGNHAVTSREPFRDYRPVKATVTFDLPRAGRRVALTFDDGNDEAAWARIVNTLRAYHVHGTFFAPPATPSARTAGLTPTWSCRAPPRSAGSSRSALPPGGGSPGSVRCPT